MRFRATFLLLIIVFTCSALSEPEKPFPKPGPMEDGVYKSYDKDGTIKTETTYEDNKRIRLKEYAADGPLIYDRNGQEIETIYVLQTMAVASESYAQNHNGNYPLEITDLTHAVPPYLGEKNDYCGATRSGYHYTCRMSEDEYLISAEPIEGSNSEDRKYEIMSGGVYMRKLGWEKLNQHKHDGVGTGPILREFTSRDDPNESTYFGGMGRGKMTGTIVKYDRNKVVMKEEIYLDGKLIDEL